jgi:hypothetical protein
MCPEGPQASDLQFRDGRRAGWTKPRLQVGSPSHITRNQCEAGDVRRHVEPEVTHEINAIDVRQTGYVIRCVCGWLTESEERESISAAWLAHVDSAPA